MTRVNQFLIAFTALVALGGCAQRDFGLPDGPLSRADATAGCARVAGGSVRDYSTYDFGRARDPRWQSVIVDETIAEPLVLELRKRLATGVLVFVGTSNWLGDEKNPGVEVVFADGPSQLDIVRIAASNAVNYDMDTEDLVARLKRYDEESGIDIIHAETDVVEFTLRRKPHDMNRFIEDLFSFCPDLAEESVDAVRAQLAKEMRVYLWWD